MFNLREDCKQRLKIAFDAVRTINQCSSFILVVDEYALKVLSHTVKMMQLINYGVASVQRFQLKRKKFKKIQAVYLISPDSYQLLLQDFPASGAQYHEIHVLMLTTIPTFILKAMGQCTMMAMRMKSLQEIYLNFLLHSYNQAKIASRCESSFGDSLQSKTEQSQNCILTTVEELSTVLLSMSSFYVVEILYNKSTLNNFSEKVAFGLKQKFQTNFKIYEKFNNPSFNSSAPPTTFIILDRTFDPVSPLVRDFHYQSMFYDQKNITQHKYEVIVKKQSKINNLDENDEIFEKYKHSHLAVLVTDINKDFEKFTQNNVAKFEKEQQEFQDMQKMAEILKQMPQYSVMKEKYSLHLNTISQIMDVFKKFNYRQLGELQQTIVSMVTSEGKKAKDKDLFNHLVNFLEKNNKQSDNIRLILIALMSLQLKPKQKNLLVEKLNQTKHYRGIESKIQPLTGFGICRLNAKKNAKQDTLILDKHQPKIEQLLRQIVNGGRGDLKFLRVGSDSRASKISKNVVTNNFGRKKIGMQQGKVIKPRLIVFMASGIGYNQMRCISQFNEHYDIIIASHNFLTQNQYINCINEILLEQQL